MDGSRRRHFISSDPAASLDLTIYRELNAGQRRSVIYSYLDNL